MARYQSLCECPIFSITKPAGSPSATYPDSGKLQTLETVLHDLFLLSVWREKKSPQMIPAVCFSAIKPPSNATKNVVMTHPGKLLLLDNVDDELDDGVGLLLLLLCTAVGLEGTLAEIVVPAVDALLLFIPFCR